MREPVLDARMSLTHTVAPDDVAAFSGEVVHELYGTACVVREMEHVARLHILPLLETGEGSVGREVVIRHRAPVAVGEEVEFTATVSSWTRRTLTTDVVARHGDRVIAEGHVVQGVVDADAFARNYGRSNSNDHPVTEVNSVTG